MSSTIGHVVVFGPPLFGHLVPILDLARHLAQHHHVTFVTSVSVLSELRARKIIIDDLDMDEIDGLRIEFVGLFDNKTLNLGRDEVVVMNKDFNLLFEESQESISTLFRLLSNTSESANRSKTNPSFTRQLSRRVDLIISDFFQPAVFMVAHELKIPVQSFISVPFDYLLVLNNVLKGNPSVSLFQPRIAEKILSAFTVVQGIIVNSVAVFERQIMIKVMKELEILSTIPVRFVAPTISLPTDEQSWKTQADAMVIKHWLDQLHQAANQSSSVIYLAFGSIVRFSPQQIREIADAVTPYRVLWSLDARSQSYLSESFKQNSSRLILEWIPQRLVLSHPAIRLFISHAGWNSLLEAILATKPMLVWPRFGDQYLNSRFIQKKFKFGQSIHSGTPKTNYQIVPSQEISQKVRTMMQNEQFYVTKVRRVKRILENSRKVNSRQHLHEISQIIRNAAESKVSMEHVEL